jgi:hypothetical protein
MRAGGTNESRRHKRGQERTRLRQVGTNAGNITVMAAVSEPQAPQTQLASLSLTSQPVHCITASTLVASLPVLCVTASALHHCQCTASLPVHCITASALHHCQHTASLPAHCITASALHHCQHTASLPAHCITASTLHHCQHTASLPAHCITASALHHVCVYTAERCTLGTTKYTTHYHSYTEITK